MIAMKLNELNVTEVRSLFSPFTTIPVQSVMDTKYECSAYSYIP